MAAKRKLFCEETQCGHCGHYTPLEVIGSFSAPGETHDRKPYYDLRFCPACHRPSLAETWPDNDGKLDVQNYAILYPQRRTGPTGLPEAISRAYDAATKVKAIDVNAYGVLVGRLLEMVCTDRKASGSTLDEQLRDLASRQEVPDKLVNVARRLRQLRNIGAHASLGNLTSRELPILESMTNAILEYVYSAPFMVKEAETQLAQLRAKSPKRSKSKAKPNQMPEDTDRKLGDP